jgi:hypothetical protein
VLDQQDHKEHKVQQVVLVPLDLKAHKALRVGLVPLVHKALKEHRDQQDH